MTFYKVFTDEEEYYFTNLNDAQEMVLSWEQEIMLECFNYGLIDEVSNEKCNVERILPWEDRYGVVCANCANRRWCDTLATNLINIRNFYTPNYVTLVKCSMEEWK